MNNYFPYKKSPICDPVPTKPNSYNNSHYFYKDSDFRLDASIKTPMDELNEKNKLDYDRVIKSVYQFNQPASNDNIIESKEYKDFTKDEIQDKTLYDINKMMDSTINENISKEAIKDILGNPYDNTWEVKSMYNPVWSNLPVKPFNIYKENTKYSGYTPLMEGSIIDYKM